MDTKTVIALSVIGVTVLTMMATVIVLEVDDDTDTCIGDQVWPAYDYNDSSDHTIPVPIYTKCDSSECTEILDQNYADALFYQYNSLEADAELNVIYEHVLAKQSS